MKRRYIVSRQANSDLDRIADEIGRESYASANLVLDKLLETFQRLADQAIRFLKQKTVF